MKKGVLVLSSFIFLAMINLVSAQDLLSDLLNTFDESMIVLSAVFIISFSMIFFALNKSLFKENKPIAGVIAAAVAFLIVYGVNKTGFDFGGFFLDIGISESIFMTIIPLIILAGVVFTIIALGKKSLFVFGGLLVAVSFFVHAKELLMIVGIILLIIGFALLKKTGNKNENLWERGRR